MAACCLFGQQAAATAPVLSEACEVELALSAAPHYLQAGASVWVMNDTGYAMHRQGSNPFSCIVNRDHPKVLKPTCFDAEGARTIVPKIVAFGAMLQAGVDLDVINDRINEGFAQGKFESPQRPGVAYMLSRYNRPYNSNTGELGWFPPHVMFYAPDLVNEDIGHDMRYHNPKQPLPMIAYQGPQGYMIMISDDGTKRSRADLPSCPDWVFAESTDEQ